MIEISARAASVLLRSHIRKVRAESWLGGTLLAADIPVASGQETVDRSLRIPERVTLTVPRRDPRTGIDWSPYTDDAPLAANGQRLKIEIGIGLGAGQEVEWLQRGWFLIMNSDVTGDEVDVELQGLLTLIDEGRLVSPFQPTGTLIATLQGLLEPALSITVSGPADRSTPSGVNYDEDRLGAVQEILDAWPAEGTVTPDGTFAITSPSDDSTDPVISLTDGQGGTVIQVVGGSTREGAWNVVVARGTDANGGQVQGVAYLERGPKRYGTDFNPLPVPYFFSSPLLTTVDQARQAANTVMQRLSRDVDRRLTVEMVPNPALLPGDVVAITSDAYTGNAVIEVLTLPYMPDDGAMSLTVRVIE